MIREDPAGAVVVRGLGYLVTYSHLATSTIHFRVSRDFSRVCKYTRYMYNDDPLRQRRPHTRTSQVTKVTHTQTLLHSKAGGAGRIGLRGGRRRALTQWGRSNLLPVIHIPCVLPEFGRERGRRELVCAHPVPARLVGTTLAPTAPKVPSVRAGLAAPSTKSAGAAGS